MPVVNYYTTRQFSHIEQSGRENPALPAKLHSQYAPTKSIAREIRAAAESQHETIDPRSPRALKKIYDNWNNRRVEQQPQPLLLNSAARKDVSCSPEQQYISGIAFRKKLQQPILIPDTLKAGVEMNNEPVNSNSFGASEEKYNRSLALENQSQRAILKPTAIRSEAVRHSAPAYQYSFGASEPFINRGAVLEKRPHQSAMQIGSRGSAFMRASQKNSAA